MRFLLVAHIERLLPVLIGGRFDFEIVCRIHASFDSLRAIATSQEEFCESPALVIILNVCCAVICFPDILISRLRGNPSSMFAGPILDAKVGKPEGLKILKNLVSNVSHVVPILEWGLLLAYI